MKEEPSITRRQFGALALALGGCAVEGSRSAAVEPLPQAPRPPPTTTRAAASADAKPGEASAPPERPLLRRFPELGARLPHARLGELPTPVERLDPLARHLGAGALWIKRDDLSGRLYGGGKTRKLEWLLGAARAQGARMVVTSGGAGSNHVVATSLYAKELGLRSVSLLLPQPATEEVRDNLLFARRFDGELRAMGGRTGITRAEQALAAEGAYVIPAGGSSPIGNVGYVDAALELEAQVESGRLPEPDVVYIPLGTMGAAAGLALGLGLTRLRTRIVAVRASSPGTSSEAGLRAMIEATHAALRALDASFPSVPDAAARVSISGRQLGGGYALPTEAGRAALEAARAHAGLELELTYTAKTMAELAVQAPSRKKEVLLFWHTHNSRALDPGPIGWRDLPKELHAYFRQ